MIATCCRKACNTITDRVDDDWLVVKPLQWNAFAKELTFCSPYCAATYLYETYAPPAGLLP